MNNLEGSLVLEKLAEIDKVDEFFEAVDSDDFILAKNLMVQAGLDSETIKKVLREMSQED